MNVSVVVPTIGRASLDELLAVLAGQLGTAAPGEVELLVVRDRPVDVAVPARLRALTRVLDGPGRGPAAARNVGWRAARHDWIAFLDDDVRPGPGWWHALRADLSLPGAVGGSIGRIRVPLPPDRRPTDWERCTAALSTSHWITADMAYRRSALAAVGGFDERFPRAYREDAELAFRVRAAGWRLVRGARQTTHPVRPENRWVSLRTQRGNADDALLYRLYGSHWRSLLQVPPGRRPRHVAITLAGVGALVAAACAADRRARRPAGLAAAVGALGWLAGTAEFAAARIAPGPPTAAERTTMLLTSAAIPPLAVWHWLRGWLRAGPRPRPVR
ncbi:glycosyltransferase [Catellatospora sp. KI3]|uniref:glycosyltransferase family 2 protein n=1 Tax=Catellatospora sp. KI3 TaxID=3041620 RepID=UPI0024822CE8|nr:glycosyltransferase [Catellatospora sp. KI3]MDI1460684.1 glycosyltransferase [Catellatospora sp. KI3]